MKRKHYPIDPEEPMFGNFIERIAIDKIGSYTGVAQNPWEQLLQDADDL